MHIEFLGTGNARGLPVYGSNDPASERARHNPKFRRFGCCVLVESNGSQLVLDTGRPDLNAVLNHDKVKAFCLSHFDSDHVLGLLTLRWGRGDTQKVYCPKDAEGFGDLFNYKGMMEYEHVEPLKTFEVSPFKITPVGLTHGRPTLGYCIESEDTRFAYLTDTHGLSEETQEFLMQWKAQLLIIDCNTPPGQINKGHNNLEMVQRIHETLKPEQTFLIHIGPGFDNWYMENPDGIPQGLTVSYDGMVLDL